MIYHRLRTQQDKNCRKFSAFAGPDSTTESYSEELKSIAGPESCTICIGRSLQGRNLMHIFSREKA